MKRIMAFAFAAVSLAACGDANNNATTDRNDTSDPAATTPETTTTTTSTSNNAAYAPAEGDVTRRDGKVMVMRNGQWVEADNDVRLNDGVVVRRNGRVVREGKEIELEEGEVVNKTGDFFDRTGRALEKGWKRTKEGAKEMGRDIRDATRKAGDKIENAVDNDPEH